MPVRIFSGIIAHQRLTVDTKNTAERASSTLGTGRNIYHTSAIWSGCKMVDRIPWNVSVICETLRTSYRTGKHPYERRFGEPFDGPIILAEPRVECHPNSAKEQPEKQVLSGTLLWICVVWRKHLARDILVTDIEELEHLEHGRNARSHSQRKGGSHAREWKRIRIFFPDGSVKLAGRNQVFRTSASFQDHPCTRREAQRCPQGESDGFQPVDHKADDIEAGNDFGSISGNHIHHHAEPSVKVYVPHDGSIPISLKCIDVVRRTNTTLDGCIAGKSF